MSLVEDTLRELGPDGSRQDFRIHHVEHQIVLLPLLAPLPLSQLRLGINHCRVVSTGFRRKYQNINRLACFGWCRSNTE